MSILGAQLSSSLYPRRQCLVFGPWPPDPWPPDLWPPDPTVSKCAEVLIKGGGVYHACATPFEFWNSVESRYFCHAFVLPRYLKNKKYALH